MTPAVTVRDYRPAGAKAVADLRRAVLPCRLAAPQGIAWEVSTAPAAQRLRLCVAQRDGRIVGAVQAGGCTTPGSPAGPRCPFRSITGTAAGASAMRC
ncbi:hypothetical protein ACWIG5_18845 [Streptomyces lydicus]